MKKSLSILAAALFAVAGAQAATISFSDTIAATATNWVDNLTLQQFDGSQGTLTQVTFSYGGAVTSLFRVESLDAAPATVSANTNASLVFGLPISNTLTVTNTQTQGVGAFDGTIDFGGTSGFGPLPVSGSANDTLTIASGLGSFVGLGTYNIGVVANGLSNASGAGNLLSQINTTAGAEITVQYTFDAITPPAVPEPGSMALVGLALAGLGLTARRRTAK